MKCFFSATVGYFQKTGIHDTAHISGIESFDLDADIDAQIEDVFNANNTREIAYVASVRTISLNPVEGNGGNHTDKLIELWRIERTKGEYHEGLNTQAYVNKELAKLGIVL